jgi:two-component system LytT family response regulator
MNEIRTLFVLLLVIVLLIDLQGASTSTIKITSTHDSRLPMLRALLIDDEPLAREEMHRLLAAHPEVTIVGEADDVPSARTRLAAGGYDLVFLDIDLGGGGTGFDLVPQVIPEARIIFVTAHNNFALRAFEVNALDYLLKPVSAPRLAASLTRITAPAADSQLSTLNAPLPTLSADDRVFLKNDRGARFVPLADLAVVNSCDNYSEVFVADGSHFLVRRSLKAWESALPAENFVRVHRQAIVNLAHIERVADPDGETPSVILRGVKQPIACSHRLSPELRRRIAK